MTFKVPLELSDGELDNTVLNFRGEIWAGNRESKSFIKVVETIGGIA